MVGMGYSREEIHESLTRMKYDEITATYLLLGRKPTEVSQVPHNFYLSIDRTVGILIAEGFVI